MFSFKKRTAEEDILDVEIVECPSSTISTNEQQQPKSSNEKKGFPFLKNLFAKKDKESSAEQAMFEIDIDNETKTRFWLTPTSFYEHKEDDLPAKRVSFSVDDKCILTEHRLSTKKAIRLFRQEQDMFCRVINHSGKGMIYGAEMDRVKETPNNKFAPGQLCFDLLLAQKGIVPSSCVAGFKFINDNGETTTTELLFYLINPDGSFSPPFSYFNPQESYVHPFIIEKAKEAGMSIDASSIYLFSNQDFLDIFNKLDTFDAEDKIGSISHVALAQGAVVVIGGLLIVSTVSSGWNYYKISSLKTEAEIAKQSEAEVIQTIDRVISERIDIIAKKVSLSVDDDFSVAEQLYSTDTTVTMKAVRSLASYTVEMAIQHSDRIVLNHPNSPPIDVIKEAIMPTGKLPKGVIFNGLNTSGDVSKFYVRYEYKNTVSNLIDFIDG